MTHLEQLSQLIESETAWLDSIHEQLVDLDGGRENNPGLEYIYAGLFAAYEAAERAMSSLHKLHNDISELLAGRIVSDFSQMPVHRRDAIAAYAVAVASTQKPSSVYAAHASRHLRRFVQREAAAILVDTRLPDEGVLSYMEHLAVSMPALVPSYCGQNTQQEAGGASWGERALWALVGAGAKTAWDNR